MSDLEAGLDVLETMRRRVAQERAAVEHALANLAENLGADDPDLELVRDVCQSWHIGLVLLFDALTSSGLKRASWKPAP